MPTFLYINYYTAAYAFYRYLVFQKRKLDRTIPISGSS